MPLISPLRVLTFALLLPAALLAQAPKKKNAAPAAEPPGVSSRAEMAALTTATDPSAITVAPGFKVELIYTVPKG